MGILSVRFLLFCLGVIVFFYAMPEKHRWAILLIGSVVFYLSCGLKPALFIFITSFTAWLGALTIGRLSDKQTVFLKANKDSLTREEKTAYKQKCKAEKKRILVSVLILNFAILCVFKYLNFLIDQLSPVAESLGFTAIHKVSLIVPLGISFYTFQIMGYLIDVYWGKTEAEKNYFKVLLLTSFFPQITQGPISDCSYLSAELFKEHRFSYLNFSHGCQRFLWGLFKKMVVANITAVYVNAVFANYQNYSWLTALIGMFMYSIQIYADFSGYMDMMCGLCSIMDIKLTENFDRPYFSKSVAEYWRRWHISLGAWFKKYIYYPIAVSKWNQKLGRSAKNKFGKAFGNYLPASIALVVVWLATGLWHGASWAYIAWGGVNGLFIIFSLWTEPLYDRLKAGLRINDSSCRWRAFQVLRTFFLVTFIKVLPEVGTLAEGFGLWRKAVSFGVCPLSFFELFPFVDRLGNFIIAMAGSALMLAISLVQRKRPIFEYTDAICTPIRAVIFAGLFMLIAYYGIPASGDAGGFLYAQF